jgi:hypothetical protein
MGLNLFVLSYITNLIFLFNLMEQFGNLESFNNLNELSTSEKKRFNARVNLNVGDFSSQDSFNVNIDGKSKISIDKFAINNKLHQNAYYKNETIAGKITHGEMLSIPNWCKSNIQFEIFLSEFSNNIQYLNSFDFTFNSNNFMFNESFLKLNNRPSLQQIFIDYSITDMNVSFLRSSENLLNMEQIKSRINIGLGTISAQNDKHVFVDNITINSNTNMDFLALNSNTFIGKKNNSVLNRKYIFPKLINELYNEESIEENVLPSSLLIYNMFSNIDRLTSSNAQYNRKYVASNVHKIRDILNADSVLIKNKYLSSMSENDQEIKDNLYIGNISLQNSTNVYLNNVQISNLQFNNVNCNVLFDNTLINFDKFILKKNPGFMFINQFEGFTHTQMNDYDNSFKSNIDYSKMKIKSNLNDFSNELYKSDNTFNNKFDIFSNNAMNQNLGLDTIATSGNLIDVKNRPIFYSDLNNDTNYISKYNNLNDLNSIKITIENLQLSNMASYDTHLGGKDGSYIFDYFGNIYLSWTVDQLILNENNLSLKVDRIFMNDEIFPDFYYLQGANGVKNYEFKQLEILNEGYFATKKDIFNPFEYVRVKIDNSISPITSQRNSTQIPCAAVVYQEFLKMAKQLLNNFNIPFEFYEGGIERLFYP